MSSNKYKKGFKKAYQQLTLAQETEAREKLWAALGITTRVSFNNYLNGKIEPKASQAEAIEKVFSEYGITNIWEECEEKE